MKLVRVTWLDAMAIAEWTKQGSEIAPQRCETVGYLVGEDDGHVIVAATISGDEYNAAIQIPRPMIENLVDLEEAV
jgi:hypothetical protein